MSICPRKNCTFLEEHKTFIFGPPVLPSRYRLAWRAPAEASGAACSGPSKSRNILASDRGEAYVDLREPTKSMETPHFRCFPRFLSFQVLLPHRPFNSRALYSVAATAQQALPFVSATAFVGIMFDLHIDTSTGLTFLSRAVSRGSESPPFYNIMKNVSCEFD